MSTIKNIYIKAPKKSVNNKHLKLVVKKNSLKKINNLKNDFIKPFSMPKHRDLIGNRDSSVKILKQDSIQRPTVHNKNLAIQHQQKSNIQQNQKKPYNKIT